MQAKNFSYNPNAVLQHANWYQLVIPEHTASSKEGASYHRSHPFI